MKHPCISQKGKTKTLRDQVTCPRPEEAPGPGFELCLALDPLSHHALVLSTDSLKCVSLALCQRACRVGRAVCCTKVRRELKCACKAMNEFGIHHIVQKSFEKRFC